MMSLSSSFQQGREERGREGFQFRASHPHSVLSQRQSAPVYYWLVGNHGNETTYTNEITMSYSSTKETCKHAIRYMKTSKALEVASFLSDFFLIPLILRVYENEGVHVAYGYRTNEWCSLIRAIGRRYLFLVRVPCSWF